jgi:hypothetical protein
MIVSNNNQIDCCKYKADLTIIGGVSPYNVWVNCKKKSNYSNLCLYNCKKNVIKVIDANGCVITKCL